MSWLVCLLLVACPGMGSTPAAGHLRVAIDTAAADADWSRTAARQQIVILQGSEVERMRALKAADPRVKVLLYKNLSAMAYGIGSTGVDASEAPPEWFLLDRAGQRFTFGGFDWLWAADVGNPGYQERWAEAVGAQLAAEGWDGVFMDDTNPTIRYHHAPEDVAQYPDDAAYAAAMERAVAAIGPRLREQGRLVFANLGAWHEHPHVARWLRHLDGAMDEHFVKWSEAPGAGYLPQRQWEIQLDALKLSQRMGKRYLAVTHSSADDVEAARYAWATLLLGADGNASFGLHPDYTQETWFPEYDLALGRALGEETVDDAGVHRRQFANGLAIVNPTGAVADVDLGDAYAGPGVEEPVRQLTLAPQSGRVLVRVR